MSEISIIFKRELLKFLKTKARILNSLISPILFILLFSYIYKNEKTSSIDVSSFQIVIFGIIPILAFSTSLESSADFSYDKEKEFMREILVSPLKRVNIVLGKIISDIITSLVVITLIIIFSLFVGAKYSALSFVMLYVASALISAVALSIGLYFAFKTKNQMSYRLTITLITLPIMFLSGSYIPVDLLPNWLKIVTYFNPLSYIVYFTEYIGISELNIPNFINPYFYLLFVLIIAILLFSITVSKFDKLLMKSFD